MPPASPSIAATDEQQAGPELGVGQRLDQPEANARQANHEPRPDAPVGAFVAATIDSAVVTSGDSPSITSADTPAGMPSDKAV